jgi:hypothetical protein
MSDLENKYRRLSESATLKLSLDNYILLPDSRVKCNITLTPKYNIKLGKLDQELIIKLTQFEKCEYKKDDDESSNDKETLLLEKKFIKHFPDIISKVIIIKDIEFEVPSASNKLFFPSFEYRKKITSLFVRHLLTVEIPGFEVMESVGLIICKLPNKIYKIEKKNSNIFKDKDISTFFGLKSEGKLSYNISLKKQVYNPKEEIPINISINSTELTYLNIELIEIIFQRKIIIYGFIINTEEKVILDKKSFNNIDQKIVKFNTQLKFDNKDIPELSQKEIEKYSNFDKNFLERDDNRTQLTPSMDGSFFKCEYKIKINMSLDNIYGKTISEYFIIDIYDIYNISQEAIPDNLKHYFLIKENELFEKQSKNIEVTENNDERKNKNDDDEFVIFDHEDFISTVEGKK